MFGDEVDYFYRLSSVGKISTFFDAKHYHPDVSLRKLDNKKIYFYLRNSIILNKKYFNHFLFKIIFKRISHFLKSYEKKWL